MAESIRRIDMFRMACVAVLMVVSAADAMAQAPAGVPATTRKVVLEFGKLVIRF